MQSSWKAHRKWPNLQLAHQVWILWGFSYALDYAAYISVPLQNTSEADKNIQAHTRLHRPCPSGLTAHLRFVPAVLPQRQISGYPRHNGALLTPLCINTSNRCSPPHLCNPQGTVSGACFRRRWIRESLPYQPSPKGQVQLRSLHREEGNAQYPSQSLSMRGRRQIGACMAVMFAEGKEVRAGVAVTVLKEKWALICSPRRCVIWFCSKEQNQSKNKSK